MCRRRLTALGVLVVLVGCGTADKTRQEPPTTSPPTVSQVLHNLHRGYASSPRLRSRPTLIAWAPDGTTPVVSAGMAIDYDHTAQHLRWATDDMKLVIADGRMQFMGRTADEAWRTQLWTGSVVEGIAALFGSTAHVPAELLLYEGPPDLDVLGRITGGTIGAVISIQRMPDPPEGVEVLYLRGRNGTADITIDTTTWRLRSVEAVSRIVGDDAIEMPPIRTTITWESTCPEQFDPPIVLMTDVEP